MSIVVSPSGVFYEGKKVKQVRREKGIYVLVLQDGKKVPVCNEIAMKVRRRMEWQR